MRIKMSKISGDYSTIDTYKVTIKNTGVREKRTGTIDINYVAEIVKVDVKEKLHEKEKFEILKQLFYKLCYTPVEKCLSVGSDGKSMLKTSFVEQFKFVDVNDKEADNITIIEELLEYPNKAFRDYKKKERLISAINESNNTIENGRKLKSKYIELPPVIYLDDKEVELYRKILCRYLQNKEYKFCFNDVSKRYKHLRSEWGYYYYIRVFEFVEE